MLMCYTQINYCIRLLLLEPRVTICQDSNGVLYGHLSGRTHLSPWREVLKPEWTLFPLLLCKGCFRFFLFSLVTAYVKIASLCFCPRLALGSVSRNLLSFLERENKRSRDGGGMLGYSVRQNKTNNLHVVKTYVDLHTTPPKRIKH